MFRNFDAWLGALEIIYRSKNETRVSYYWVFYYCISHNLKIYLTDLQKDALADEDFFLVSKLFNVEDLLNAKVHLGHHEGCWNPYMKPYIYGSRERFHIINLDVTSKHLKVTK